MQGAQLTEERLRNWLDSNQVQRERMCLALLSLNKRYTNIRPRRPKGGPDGSRDIEAVYEDQFEVWGAVGFRNSASDSPNDKKWLSDKFSSDLESALTAHNNLKGFVFLTNVDLTPGEENKLKQEALAMGLAHVEVFYRERLRILLDSPEGLGLRFQYLGIPLSEAEQAAFFERFGTQLEEMMLQQFSAVDKKLQRIEFFHDCSKPLMGISAILQLNRECSPDELGHFRFVIEILNLHEHDPHPAVYVAGRDSYPTHHQGNKQTIMFGQKSLVWSREPNESIQNTIESYGMLSTSRIDVGGHMYKKGPYLNIGDFDQRIINVYITKPLVEAFDGIGLVANDYLLTYVDKPHLVIKEMDPLFEWPEELTEEEKAVPWVTLLIKGDDPSLPPPAWPTRSWELKFSEHTPQKMSNNASERA